MGECNRFSGLSLAIKVLNKYIQGTSTNIDKNYKMSLYRIFFKSWANVWKLNISQERKIMLLSCDPHAPCDFRGNLVKNCNEFYMAFDIKSSDKMYISEDKRLVMW